MREFYRCNALCYSLQETDKNTELAHVDDFIFFRLKYISRCTPIMHF